MAGLLSQAEGRCCCTSASSPAPARGASPGLLRRRSRRARSCRAATQPVQRATRSISTACWSRAMGAHTPLMLKLPPPTYGELAAPLAEASRWHALWQHCTSIWDRLLQAIGHSRQHRVPWRQCISTFSRAHGAGTQSGGNAWPQAHRRSMCPRLSRRSHESVAQIETPTPQGRAHIGLRGGKDSRARADSLSAWAAALATAGRLPDREQAEAVAAPGGDLQLSADAPRAANPARCCADGSLLARRCARGRPQQLKCRHPRATPGAQDGIRPAGEETKRNHCSGAASSCYLLAKEKVCIFCENLSYWRCVVPDGVLNPRSEP